MKPVIASLLAVAVLAASPAVATTYNFLATSNQKGIDSFSLTFNDANDDGIMTIDEVTLNNAFSVPGRQLTDVIAIPGSINTNDLALLGRTRGPDNSKLGNWIFKTDSKKENERSIWAGFWNYSLLPLGPTPPLPPEQSNTPAVPAPASLALGLTGLTVLGGLAYRQRRNKTAA
ncbi:MAG: hypothetical protein ACK5IB_03550 [Qingshengfaniella sp.]